jgi:hypothetical protein
MRHAAAVLLLTFIVSANGFAQTSMRDGDFQLALPDHHGLLRWHAEGFTIVELSAKPGGREMGVRGKEASGQITSLGFLFLVPEGAPLTSDKCRDGAIQSESKGNPTLKVRATSEITGVSGSPPVSVVSYTARGGDGKMMYLRRAFVATGDICGDLEFYSGTPIDAREPELKKIFASYILIPATFRNSTT